MRVLWVVALVLVTGVAQAKRKDEAPPVDRAAIHASLKTVGMLPMRVPGFLPDAEAVTRRFESAVEQRLRAAGFEVINADAMRAIQADLSKAMGGLYDPLTGEASAEKLETRAKFARSEYLAAHQVDGFVRLGIVVRDAPSFSMTASWDGVEERVTGQSTFKSIMTRAAAGLGDGSVPALSLVLVLEDRDGKALYGRYGGLQLMAYIRMGWVPKFHDVDPAYLLTDPARDTRALALVFDPLAGETGAGKTRIALAPAATGDDSGALRIPKDKLLGAHRRVAIAGLDIGAIAQADSVKSRYAALLRKQLTAAGFEVAAEADFDALWREAERQAGGFHDPVTGRLDRPRYQAARREVLQKLSAAQGVTAVVFPSIASRQANLVSGVATWDGAEQILTGGKSKFGAMFSGAGQYMGRVQALSLQLRIAGLDDVTLFEDFGGIQSLSRFEQGRFVDLPEEQLFSEPVREEKSVELALAEITGKPGTR